jgi:hypothetical protein
MIQVSLFGFAVGGAFLGLSNWDLPYYLVGLVAVVNSIVQERLSEQVNERHPGQAASARAPIDGFAQTIIQKPAKPAPWRRPDSL